MVEASFNFAHGQMRERNSYWRCVKNLVQERKHFSFSDIELTELSNFPFD